MIEEQVAALDGSGEDIPQCNHHWVIQDGDGPKSAGVCRLCGALKEFRNYLEASYWGEEKNKSDSRASLLGRPSRALIILEDEDNS